MRPADPTSTDASPLADYLGVLRRRKWLLLLSTVAVPAVVLVLSLSREPTYEGRAEVLLTRQSLPSSLTGTTDPSVFLDETRFAQTQAQLASVPEVADRTLAAAGLGERSTDELLDASTVSAKPNVDLLEFRVRDGDADVARRLATTYANEFTRFRAELDTAAISRARLQVQERIEELRATGDDPQLLTTLLDKEQQLQTVAELQTSNTFVVREADEAEQVSPQPLRDALLATILGLGLGLAVVLLAETVDMRVRSPEEISHRLGLPLLGNVPAPPRRLRRQPAVGMIEEPASPHAEAFRMLRTSVEFANIDLGARTLMITSSLEGEGKSTTAANLAVAYAQAGKHVVLVDLDLRRPMIHELFDVEPTPGLGDVVLGSARLAEAVRAVPIRARSRISPASKVDGSLRVLTAGTAPPDPGAFVSSAGVERVLAQVQERPDLVLIDAPPLLQVGDALALTARVDAVLLIGRVKLVRRQMLREVARILKASPAPTLGVIATGVDTSVSYGYGYLEAKTGSRRRRGQGVLARIGAATARSAQTESPSDEPVARASQNP